MKKHLWLLLCILTAGAVELEAAAEGRWGLALNEKNKGCGHVWEGNSCMKVSLPEGWQAVYPKWDDKANTYALNFQDKQCAWDPTKPQECCGAFGLTFDKNFKAVQEPTARQQDPKSECYQLPDKPSKKPARKTR